MGYDRVKMCVFPSDDCGATSSLWPPLSLVIGRMRGALPNKFNVFSMRWQR